MDLTPNYIEMCSKAQEIQEYYYNNKQRENLIPDQVFDKEYNSVVNSLTIYKEEFGFWVLRQDQLQDMIEGSLMNKLSKFIHFIAPPLFIHKDIDEDKFESFKVEWRKATHDQGKILITDCEPELTWIEGKSPMYFISLEQAWLAFVMKEKYNKQWNFETKEWEVVK